MVIANSSTETPISNHLESVRQASPWSNKSWHQPSDSDWNVEVTDDGWGPIEQNPAWDEPKKSAPPPVLVDDQEEYEIHEIMDSKLY